MDAGQLGEFVRTLSFALIPVLFGITVHEVAHGWMARRFGDRTAEMLGRLTLNPVRHIDPMGTIVVPALMMWFSGFLFGWAKPVPVNARNFSRPRAGMVWVAAAGPGANLLMALGWALGLKLVLLTADTASGTGLFLFRMCQIGVFFNVLLAVFNMLPIPPLDGGRVLRGLVPEPAGQVLDRIEPFGLIIVIGLLVIGAVRVVLLPVILWVQGLVLAVAGV